jgi:hypothetical protein
VRHRTAAAVCAHPDVAHPLGGGASSLYTTPHARGVSGGAGWAARSGWMSIILAMPRINSRLVAVHPWGGLA